MQNSQGNTARRKKAYLSIIGTTQLHLRSPLIIGMWSILFPGLSHILLSKYIRGFLLFIWELYVNYQANINLAIYHSFLGNFETAKEVLDINWMLLYIPTYIFAFWDGYRTAVDLNKDFLLAAREDAPISAQKIGAMEINYLDKRKPWIATVWSALMPGTGQLYTDKIITAFFIIIWWIVVVYMSKVLPAVHYSMIGDFQRVKDITDIRWLMNIPSIYLFSIYEAYVGVVENNNLFDWEQTRFFKKHYQSHSFIMPIEVRKRGGDSMYIISTFEHTKYLELAITAIQMKGIPKGNILATTVDTKGQKRVPFDSIHNQDGLSFIDLSCILGAMTMLIGSIYGFVLEWGPIWWGVIGLGIGFIIGFIIKLIVNRKYLVGRANNKKSAEVVLIIECEKDQAEMVRSTLWDHFALGVSKLDLCNELMIK